MFARTTTRDVLGGLCLLALATACADPGLTDPDPLDIPAGQAELLIYMDMGDGSVVAGLVVEVTAPDLAQPIVANIPVSSGVGSGSVLVPAGSDRTVTIRAFNADGIKTHEGSTVIDVVEGTNPTVAIELEPVFGDVPLQVTLGSFVLSVTPTDPILRVGDAVQLTATLLDGSATQVVRTLTWGSTNPVVAGVDGDGLVTGGVTGVAEVIVSYGDVRAVATVIVTDREWTQIVVGERHACGLDDDGRAFCWGGNAVGQVGNGTTDDQPSPVAVSGNHRFASLTAGGLATCGITVAGEGLCWGRGTLLGDNDPAVSVSTPTSIVGGHQWSVLEVGVFHACGVTDLGEAYCWGFGGAGRLGNGTSVEVDAPSLVSGGLSWVEVSAARQHTCGVTATGEGYCWGLGQNGRLGDGTTTNSDVPVLVLGGHAWSTISAGGHHSCGVTTAGAALCWGYGLQGQLGYGGQGAFTGPIAVSSAANWSAIDAGAHHTCGVTVDHEGFCWGFGAGGQMGNGVADFFNFVPVAVSGGLAFASVEASDSPYGFGTSATQGFSCGRTINGGAYCWGYNNRGQLGDGSLTNRVLPTPVLDP